ncbi:MAG: carboxylating nicotinate-nucleotide diphosphorylase [Thermodesulfobacteriota bacterium]|nr:carboxylating nicotinate-nucleotide diphosphorylase [Thermodesulfobacteriota bacterium]
MIGYEEDIVRLALAEDIGSGDLTTSLTVDPSAEARAEITAKQNLVLAGLSPARLAFELVDPKVGFEPLAADGDRIESGQVLVRLGGPAASILTAERVALNFLMRLSGVATLTASFALALQGYKTRVVDTRKTTPGMRVLEKAAVRAGGGINHRFGLYDGILIKDNHIAAAGSITAAMLRAGQGAPHTLKVEIEVEDLAGLEEAVTAGADAVLLDNMTIKQLTEAAALAGGRVLLEASGGITLDNAARIAATGVDLISVGALTHSAPAADISLRFC